MRCFCIERKIKKIFKRSFFRNNLSGLGVDLSNRRILQLFFKTAGTKDALETYDLKNSLKWISITFAALKNFAGLPNRSAPFVLIVQFRISVSLR